MGHLTLKGNQSNAEYHFAIVPWKLFIGYKILRNDGRPVKSLLGGFNFIPVIPANPTWGLVELTNEVPLKLTLIHRPPSICEQYSSSSIIFTKKSKIGNKCVLFAQSNSSVRQQRWEAVSQKDGRICIVVHPSRQLDMCTLLRLNAEHLGSSGQKRVCQTNLGGRPRSLRFCNQIFFKQKNWIITGLKEFNKMGQHLAFIDLPDGECAIYRDPVLVPAKIRTRRSFRDAFHWEITTQSNSAILPVDRDALKHRFVVQVFIVQVCFEIGVL